MPTPTLSPYAARGRSSYRNDAGTDYLSSTDVPSPTNWTVCGWAVKRVEQSATNQWMIGADNDSTSIYQLMGWASSGSFVILNNTGGQSSAFSVTPGLNEPFFFAMSCAGTAAGDHKGYIRRLRDTAFSTQSIAGSASVFTRFRIGATSFPRYLRGCYWSVRVWNAVLSAAEIAQEFLSPYPAHASNLHAWYPLEGNIEQLLRDYSGNGRHLTRAGSGRAERFFLPASVLMPLVDDAAVDAAAGGGATVDLASVSAGQATPTGTLSITARLVAAALGIATPAGTISVALNPAGAVAGAALVAGALSLDVPLQASAQAVAQTGGNLGAVKPLAGVSAGLAAIDGTLSVSNGAALDGAASGATQVVGALDLLKPLSGASLGQAAVVADLQAIRAMAGGAAGSTAVTGGLSLAIAFDGAALGQAFVQGALQIDGAVDLAGSARGAATAQGALDKLAALSAAAGGEAGVRATLALTLNLAGAAGGQAAGAGTLLVQGGISGAVLAEAMATGMLTLAVNLSGAALAQALVGAFFDTPQWAGTTVLPGLSIYYLSPHVDVAGDDLDIRVDDLSPHVAAQLAYA